MKIVGNDWENGPNSSKSLPNCPKMSQNVPSCPKMSQNAHFRRIIVQMDLLCFRSAYILVIPGRIMLGPVLIKPGNNFNKEVSDCEWGENKCLGFNNSL